MKKITILSALVFCFALIANAQTEKGRYMVGGSVGFSSTKDKFESGGSSSDGDKYTNIWVMPTFGLFIADGIVVGAGLSITSNKTASDASDFTNTKSGLSVAPFGRYYHDSGLFGHVNLEFGTANDKDEGGQEDIEFKESIFGWKVGGGYALFINNNVIVEPMITYGSTTNKPKDSDSDFKSTNSGLMVSVGFNVLIN